MAETFLKNNLKPKSDCTLIEKKVLPKASIVVPVRASAIEQRELNRLETLLSCIPAGYEVIVVDDGSPRRVGAHLKSLTERFNRADKTACYVSLKTRLRRFSLARARNAGARAASSPVVIFHDVDFLGTSTVYKRLLSYIEEQNVAQHPENFFCVPVAFLTEEATQNFMHHFHLGEELWCFKNISHLSEKKIQFLVQGSSCLVINKEDLLSIGGHNEKFKGHGAEDFELLHRLSSRYPIAPRPPEYEKNFGSGTVTEYRGFRAYFSLYGEQCRQAGCTLVHLWHPKRVGFGYYRHKKNFKMLAEIMTTIPDMVAMRPTLSPEEIFGDKQG